MLRSGGGFGGSSGFDMGSSNDMGYDGPPSTGYSPGTPLHEEAPYPNLTPTLTLTQPQP